MDGTDAPMRRDTQHVTLSADVDPGADSLPIEAETLDLREGDIVAMDPIVLLAFLRIEPEEVQLGVKEGNEAVAFCKLDTPIVAGAYSVLDLLTTLGEAVNDDENLIVQDKNGRAYPITVNGNHASSATQLSVDPAINFPIDVIDGIVRYPDSSTRSLIRMNVDNINLRVQKDDVINQINISIEGILIDADVIQIDGAVTFASRYDPLDKAETFISVTAPVDPEVGWIWHDTSGAGEKEVKRWNGSTWEIFASEDTRWRHGSDKTKIDGGDLYTDSVTTTAVNWTPVGVTNVVATINATSEGIRISAGLIQIDGTVIFGSGYDPSTKETPAGAQSKADAAESDANDYTDTEVAPKAHVYRQATTPVGMDPNDLWVDTSASGADRKTVKRYNGATWDVVGTDDADWRHANDFTKIDGGDVYANSITTTEINWTPVDTGNVVGTINASSEGLEINFDKVTISGALAIGERLESDGYVAGSSGWAIDGDDDIEFWMNNDLLLGSAYGLRFGGTQPIEWRNSLPSGALEAKIWSPNTQGVLQLVGDDGAEDVVMTLWGFVEKFLVEITSSTVFEISGTKTHVFGGLEVDGDLNHDGTKAGLFGVVPTTRQTVSGNLDTGLAAAVRSLLDGLAPTGIINDTTTGG